MVNNQTFYRTHSKSFNDENRILKRDPSLLYVYRAVFRRLTTQPDSIVFDCEGVAPICLVHQQHLIRRARRMEQSQLEAAESRRILSLTRARYSSAFINWRFIDVCISSAQRVRIASSHSAVGDDVFGRENAQVRTADPAGMAARKTPTRYIGCNQVNSGALSWCQ